MTAYRSIENVRGATGDGPDKDGRWWRDDLKDEDRYEVANAVFQRVRSAQETRIAQLLKYQRLYHNAPLRGVGTKLPTGVGERLALNVVKSCSDAFVAKITKENPKPWFVTSGGSWAEQQKAKDLDKYIEAQFYETRFYEARAQAWLDACWSGTGILKPYFIVSEGDDDHKPAGRLVLDRVLPYEVYVDDLDGLYGRPSQLWHTQRVDRMRLAWMFRDDPAKHAAIMAANVADDNDPRAVDTFEDTISDRLRVTEQWHLPSGPGAGDGGHLICINNATLFYEPWGYDYFPFLFFRRQFPPTGFWGISLAAELAGIQLEINILLAKIQRSHHLLGAGHWLVEAGSRVDSHHLDNEIGSIIRYSGIKPELSVGMAVAPEIYQHLDRLYGRAFEITGISQLTAQSQKPAGLNSGKALDTFADIETERFAVATRNDQQAVLDAAKQYVDRIKELSEQVPDLVVKGQSKSNMVRLRWKDVKLDEEAYVLKASPANALSSDPVEKMQQVQTMTDAGWIPPEKARRLLDYPDLEAYEDQEDASYALINDIVEKMLEDGEYFPPEPMMNLSDGLAIVQLRYLQAKRRGAPDDKLELLRRWMTDANELSAPPPEPGPPPGAGPPGAQPPPSPPPGGPLPPPPPGGSGGPMPPDGMLQ